MAERIYPLNALRAFEAAGRHLSFVRAAAELHVTPAAISYQVKRLENYLGVQLFQRLSHGLLLTDTSERLLPELRQAFSLLDAAMDWAKGHGPVATGNNDPKVCREQDAPPSFPDLPSIVVLPFANLNREADEEYLADGLTEDVIAELSKNTDFLVLARSASFAYQATRLSAPQLSKELGVRYVLEGSVRRLDSRVRIRAQLIDGNTGHHVWGERYDGDSSDVFELQDEVVHRIIVTIGGTHGKLDQLARAQAARKSTDNLAAYECFLRGREHLNRFRVRDTRFVQAMEMFERAIELDPQFYRAYLGLALFHVWEVKGGRTATPARSLKRANELAEQAVNIYEPNHWSHWGHWILGTIYVWAKNPGRAMAHYGRALELSPNDGGMLIGIAENWCYLGRASEAVELAKEAMRLSPNYSDMYRWVLAFAHFTDGQYEDALTWLNRIIEPGDSNRLLAATYAKLERLEEARAAAAQFRAGWPHFSIGDWVQFEPYQNSADLENYADGLRMAGL